MSFNFKREDWRFCDFEEIFEVKGGSQPPKSTFKYEEKDGYIRLLQIRDFGNKPVPTYVPKDSVTKFCNEDDVLIARYGASLGRIVTGMAGAYNVALAKVIPIVDSIFDTWFVFYMLQTTILQQPLKMISRSAQNGFAKSDIARIKTPLVPIPEQRAIVKKIEELFSDLDKGVSDLKKAQYQLKVYRQAVLKKAFEGELTKEWREQQIDLPSAAELLEQIKEERQKHYEQQLENWKQAVKAWEENGKKGKKPSKPQKHKEVEELTKAELEELASLPSNWKWIKNNELMYYVTSGSRDWKKFYSDTKGTYFVRTQDIKTNKLDLDGAAFVDLPEHVEGKRSLIEKGDLLMTITGANVGKIAHVDFNISEAYVSQSVALMKYVLKSFSPYLHYYFQSSATGAKFIGAMVYGVGRPVLSLDNMRDAPVSVCSFEEQRQIVQEIESRLSVCDKVEESITVSLEKAKALRQSILKKAFEGNLLSPQEIEKCKAAPDYEPAAVLLEKIKMK